MKRKRARPPLPRSPFPRKEPHAQEILRRQARTPCGRLLQLERLPERSHRIPRSHLQRLCHPSRSGGLVRQADRPAAESRCPCGHPQKACTNDRNTREEIPRLRRTHGHQLHLLRRQDRTHHPSRDTHHLHRRLLPREPQWARRICRRLPHCRGQRAPHPLRRRARLYKQPHGASRRLRSTEAPG